MVGEEVGSCVGFGDGFGVGLRVGLGVFFEDGAGVGSATGAAKYLTLTQSLKYFLKTTTYRLELKHQSLHWTKTEMS